MLPVIKLGGYDISRLIIGGNPLSGNSHVSLQMNEEMEDFFTTAQIKKTLFHSEKCGLNAMQMRGDRHIIRIMREYRSEGGKMHWIAQTASEIQPYESNISQIVKNDPVAIYHHGTVTDELFKNGDFRDLKKRLSVIRESGKAVGLGTHMPQVIEYAEEHDWDIDFYMASVYNLSKIDRVSSVVTGIANCDEPFDDEDCAIMYRTIRATNKTCLVFKILGATRKCQSPDTVRGAFAEAFRSIKSIDAVVVGMFPKEKDQVAENAGFVMDILG